VKRYSALTRRAAWGALLAALVALAGCGKKGGPSDNDLRLQGIQDAATDLKSKGAKIEDRTYQIGHAKAVNLSGMEVNEQVLRQVKSLGNISELNLSKTTFSDEHMALFQELELGTFAVKLDFSHTALTDAGFEKLNNLRFLSNLNLTGTKVSRKAVDAFKKKRQDDTGVNPMFRNPTVQMN
jgi:hypothetical protein